MPVELANAIEAGGSIDSGNYGIVAGENIEAQNTISCGKRIFAGISTRCNFDDCDRTIKCKKLLKGEIGYGELVIVD